MSDLPAPLTDFSLPGFRFMSLDLDWFIHTDAWMMAKGDEHRVIVELWSIAWRQCPAASLPNDDQMLSKFAQFGKKRDFSGYCKAASESAIEFTVNSENNTEFGRLGCSAYDLKHDPEKRHRIQPLLAGPEGLSKRISVPFLKPLSANEPFDVMLKCTLPRCIKAGFSYYASVLQFAQDRVGRCEVRLIFAGPAPSWLRVYESTLQKPAALVKTLPPLCQERGFCEYLDVAQDRSGQSARVYMFWRESL